MVRVMLAAAAAVVCLPQEVKGPKGLDPKVFSAGARAAVYQTGTAEPVQLTIQFRNIVPDSVIEKSPTFVERKKTGSAPKDRVGAAFTSNANVKKVYNRVRGLKEDGFIGTAAMGGDEMFVVSLTLKGCYEIEDDLRKADAFVSRFQPEKTRKK